jgi:hypothetical protein
VGQVPDHAPLGEAVLILRKHEPHRGKLPLDLCEVLFLDATSTSASQHGAHGCSEILAAAGAVARGVTMADEEATLASRQDDRACRESCKSK